MNSTSNSRRGTSLIEALVVTLLSGIVLGMAVYLLAMLMSRQQAADARAQRRAAIDRLADALRDDMRLATAVEAPVATELLLHMPRGGQVTYDLAGTVCLRTQSSATDQPTRREAYGAGPIDSWSLVPVEKFARVTQLQIDFAAGDLALRAPPPLHIVAATDNEDFEN